MRLVGMTNITNWETGNLELFFEGSWGQVCAAGFVGPDAAVACRQLGYTAAGASIPFYTMATFAPAKYIHLNLTDLICYICSVDLFLRILRRRAVTCRTPGGVRLLRTRSNLVKFVQVHFRKLQLIPMLLRHDSHALHHTFDQSNGIRLK